MTKPLRVGLLSAWTSRSGGGVFEAVVRHALSLKETGAVEPLVFGAHDAYSDEDAARFGPVPVKALKEVGPGFFGFVPGLVDAMRAENIDVLHLHGIWKYPSAAGSAWARATGRPYVISPHGMLDPWILARGKWKKALARAAYEKESWRRAALFHALTPAEAGDIAKVVGGGTQRVVTLPNGVDYRPPAPGDAQDDASARKDVVYLGRIHPKKNIGALITAWAQLQGAMPGRLVIAGWGDDEHVAQLKAQIAGAGCDTISFIGPVFGAEKQRLFEQARFLALPSFSEGLPVVILEAWAAGVPTIMSEECNLPIGFSSNAALRSGHDPETVAQALGQAAALTPQQWGQMSANALEVIRNTYSQDSIAGKWVESYRALVGAGSSPAVAA